MLNIENDIGKYEFIIIESNLEINHKSESVLYKHPN